jgi:hypothetical protein
MNARGRVAPCSLLDQDGVLKLWFEKDVLYTHSTSHPEVSDKLLGALERENWDDTALVTPRCSILLASNRTATRRHCVRYAVHPFIFSPIESTDHS